MKKIITKVALAASLLAPLAFAMPALAATDWDVSGTYVFDYNYLGGTNLHDMTLVQDGADALTGSGGAFAGVLPYDYPWTITSGSVSGDIITFSADYDALPCSFTATGTIDPSDGSMSGTWTDNCAGDRAGPWETTSGAALLSGGVAPIVSVVLVAPAPPVAGLPTTLTANVDDTTTGNSNIASAEYSITGSGVWTPMTASDAAFDEVNEDVTASITFATPGVKEVCVRGTDAAGNTSEPSGDDCIIVEVIDPTEEYVAGGGNIKNAKGKPTWTFGGNAGTVPGVGLVGQLQVVDHVTKVACHYNEIISLDVVGNTATVHAAGTCNNGTTRTDDELIYVDNGEPGTADMFKSLTLAGGNIQVGETVALTVTTFTATDSAYYNGLDESDGLYGTGPITFTWDGAGDVTGGLWEEIVPPTSGTHYFNIVTGGTVVGGAVNLTLLRTNPNAYGPFSIVGTLVGGVLTGTAAGPYLFTATGVITP